ncbi:MAG TPA: TetR/AcrR family transcriptional regulator [Rhizomicrobium sp.]|nr:TetR/AcrR family transcriptional regulator [Rhizomicrobium sp.]
MARPKSDDKRSAILAAAARVVAAEGLGASTAAIAQAAGVSNGALFTYFETKSDLFNQLYLVLKADRAATSMDGVAEERDIRAQLFRMWANTLAWATAFPEKRKALAQLDVSEDLTAESRESGHVVMADVAALLERSRANGPMKDVPLAFIAAMVRAMTDATIEFIARDPKNAGAHSKAAFEALWRMTA